MKAAAVMNTEDDILSNLTSASGELATGFSSRTNDIDGSCNNIQGRAPPPPKKKKGLPGNPDPDAEVVALSPKSLLATNRFTCEVCNKGFKRDQNLQLHRRGHNLPWKLKQRPKSEPIRRKVYVCPEPTCTHHDPSRALGDLTGIKKHFCRKHGEKRWKCDRCEKKYAVRSDLKAHSKVCGTREYKCDCGTVFSRRDSFITHRAFCDALTQETMMKSFASPQPSPPPLAPFTSLTNTIFAPPLTHPPLNLHDHFFNHGNGFPPLPLPLPFVKLEPEHPHLPAAAFSQQQQQNFCSPQNPNPNASSSSTGASLFQEAAVTGSATVSDPLAAAGHVQESFMLQDTSMTAMMMMMNSMAGRDFDCEEGMEGMLDPKGREDHHVDGNLGMTRDFLSLSRDLVCMHGDDEISCMQKLQKGDDQHHQKQQQQLEVIWQG